MTKVAVFSKRSRKLCGRPSDVASLVTWLLKAANRFATGAEFVLDEGMTCKMIFEE